jgi:hypothetical protein
MGGPRNHFILITRPPPLMVAIKISKLNLLPTKTSSLYLVRSPVNYLRTEFIYVESVGGLSKKGGAATKK